MWLREEVYHGKIVEIIKYASEIGRFCAHASRGMSAVKTNISLAIDKKGKYESNRKTTN